MIEDTKILLELQKITSLLEQLIQVTQAPKPHLGKGYQAKLTPEEKQALDDEVDIFWWYENYREEKLPAKYMHAFSATGDEVDNLYNKDEIDYIFHRMQDFLEEENEQGTHIFKYLGKVWCKREGNTRNCFAFVPKETA